ncbi:MAG: 3-hydroxyacyl-CoA dehydrogenase NAD-binding domain-containing protein [Burkholderiaceae bacterium]
MSSVHYESRGHVAVVWIDHPPVNSLGHATRVALADALEQANRDHYVRAIVLTGTDKVFSGGADIREFGSDLAFAEPSLAQLLDLIERLSKPVIATINGVCMGGGLELALACHYRVATPRASLALPEVKLGLLPGAGGTQRLPRAVGAELALEMITTGHPIDAQTALRAGLVQAIVSDKSFDETLKFAHHVEEIRPLPLLREAGVTLPAGTDTATFFTAALERVAQRARGLTAPIACVHAVEAAVRKPFDEGLAIERKLFAKLVASSESRALRHAFFSERSAARIADVPADTPARAIRSAAVVGFGTMGSGIAMSLANAGIPVAVFEKDQAALDRGGAACRRHWEASASKGKLSAAEVEARMALLNPTLDVEDLAHADIAIEAVVEDLAVKQEIFRRLDAVMKPGAILATNTSTLDINAIAAVTRRPQDVIGLHFFSPAHVMRLLEVVRGEATAKDVLATAMALARKIGKVAVVARVCDGFIGNRMLEQYLRQSLFLLDEGASPANIDAALQKFGMAMGPFAMSDMAGMDVGYAIRQRRYREQPDLKYSRIADRVVEAGRFGQKTGQGWYRYEPGKRTPLPDPEVDALIAQHRAELGIAPRELSEEEIVGRCILALVNEGARLLEEGIAQRASDIDIVYLTGYGFPAKRGGPMFHAELAGLKRVIAQIEAFAANPHADPSFWQAALALKAAAKSGRWS